MVDEKRDRSDSGLQGSGSTFLCTLCDADRESAVSNRGNFNINRSIDENLKVYEYIRINPDKLSESVTKVCKRGEKLLSNIIKNILSRRRLMPLMLI